MKNQNCLRSAFQPDWWFKNAIIFLAVTGASTAFLVYNLVNADFTNMMLWFSVLGLIGCGIYTWKFITVDAKRLILFRDHVEIEYIFTGRKRSFRYEDILSAESTSHAARMPSMGNVRVSDGYTTTEIELKDGTILTIGKDRYSNAGTIKSVIYRKMGLHQPRKKKG